MSINIKQVPHILKEIFPIIKIRYINRKWIAYVNMRKHRFLYIIDVYDCKKKINIASIWTILIRIKSHGRQITRSYATFQYDDLSLIHHESCRFEASHVLSPTFALVFSKRCCFKENHKMLTTVGRPFWI